MGWARCVVLYCTNVHLVNIHRGHWLLSSPVSDLRLIKEYTDLHELDMCTHNIRDTSSRSCRVMKQSRFKQPSSGDILKFDE